MARFRHLHAADGWQRAVLPHTQRSADHFYYAHGHPATLPIEPEQFRTKLVNHGETRYGLQVMDSTDGWSEWSLHKQVGPDMNDPDHWERIGVPPEVHQFCHCIGEEDDEADLSYPAGVEDGLAGYVSGQPGDWKGTRGAKAAAEEAFQKHVVGDGPNIGDYDLDSFMRDHDPDEGYDIFGERP